MVDVDERIRLLIQYSHWEEAVRQATMFKKIEDYRDQIATSGGLRFLK